jgi:hypothetical protein
MGLLIMRQGGCNRRTNRKLWPQRAAAAIARYDAACLSDRSSWRAIWTPKVRMSCGGKGPRITTTSPWA